MDKKYFGRIEAGRVVDVIVVGENDPDFDPSRAGLGGEWVEVPSTEVRADGGTVRAPVAGPGHRYTKATKRFSDA